MPPQEWRGTPSIRGSSHSVRMILLTFSLIGLQLTWGLEQTYCTPYLLSLGMSKSTTSAVWVAGPLSGLLVQPIIGALADRSTSRFGRRRPYMIGGSAITSVCLILLGWTSEITSLISPSKKLTIVVAVLAIYALDFAINVVQACCRSIIVDVLPTSQQQDGSAWAARTAACGHVLGFLIGALPLADILPTWLGGDTQFKKMCLVAVTGLWITVGVTCYSVQERVLVSSGNSTIRETFTTLWTQIWKLPPRIQQICWCQFWGWIGWFPFLFYSSTWVGETYYRYEHATKPKDALGGIGRIGSLSLVLFSLVTLLSSILLPYLVRKPDEVDSIERFTPRPPPTLSKEVQKVLMRVYEGIRAMKPNIVGAWMAGNLVFAIIMVWAPFVRRLRFANVLVALCGIPWAISCWAPFSEMGVEINKLAHGVEYQAVRDDEVEMEEGNSLNAQTEDLTSTNHNDTEASRSDGTDTAAEGLLSGQQENSRDDTNGDADNGRGDVDAPSGELAGIYLGVLNVYTTLPQFVGTAISWAVFSILEPGRSSREPGDGEDAAKTPTDSALGKYANQGVNAIAVCLFIGAICALVAAEATRRLKKMT